MRYLALLAACVAAGVVCAGAAASGPPVPGHWRTFCYLGHRGEPSGCRRLFVGGLEVS